MTRPVTWRAGLNRKQAPSGSVHQKIEMFVLAWKHLKNRHNNIHKVDFYSFLLCCYFFLLDWNTFWIISAGWILDEMMVAVTSGDFIRTCLDADLSCFHTRWCTTWPGCSVHQITLYHMLVNLVHVHMMLFSGWTKSHLTTWPRVGLLFLRHLFTDKLKSLETKRL